MLNKIINEDNNEDMERMFKRRNVNVVSSDNAKLAALTSAITNILVGEVSCEELKVDWDKCLIYQTDLT